MNKYIIPLILTYILTIFITSTITIKIMEDKENQELNICKGMNNTYLEEYQNLLERYNKLEQDNMELRLSYE